jgi:aquaporin related protein
MTLLPIRSFASRSINICMSRQKFAVATTLSADTNVARGLFIEMFLTALLVFTIFMLAAEKHRATFIAPIGIGLALFVGHLAGTRFTGGSSAASP